MLTITDLRIGTKIEYKNEPYEVIEAQHLKLARGGAILRTRLKNLISGNITRVTFREEDKFQEPDLTKIDCLFMYKEGENYFFMDNTTFDQFSLPRQVLGKAADFLVENTNVEILYYKNRPININLPPKINLKVIKAPPSIRGDTVEGGTKEVQTETGLIVTVPLFIKEGDVIKVNTKDGSYVERV